MKDITKSNFALLVDYITDNQGNELRVKDIRITNCSATTIKSAVTEIKATQAHNTRSKADKNLHLLLSFRNEDMAKLTPEMLEKIEDDFCKKLGYEKHQRISCFHGDTDNPHIHIAINKIDPNNFRIKNPKGKWKTMANTCRYIEDKYLLENDNHGFEKTRSQDRARDTEKMRGTQTLTSYIKSIEGLNEAKSWKEFHQICRDNNISIKLRGNGLVFTDGEIYVKASTVNRNFSKAKMEKKYGKFIDFDFDDSKDSEINTDEKKYNKDSPADNYQLKNKEQQLLYLEYSQYRKELNYKEKKGILYENLKKKFHKIYEQRKLEILLIKNSGLSSGLKKFLYSFVKKSIEKEKETIALAEKFRLRKLREKNTWRGYLHDQAQQGNGTAAEILRNSQQRKISEAAFKKLEEKLNVRAKYLFVTKSGTKIYKTDNHYIRLSAKGLYIQKIEPKNKKLNFKNGFIQANLNDIDSLDITEIIRKTFEQQKIKDQIKNYRNTGKLITAIRKRVTQVIQSVAEIKERINQSIRKGRRL